jgi:hypothetical protein
MLMRKKVLMIIVIIIILAFLTNRLIVFMKYSSTSIYDGDIINEQNYNYYYDEYFGDVDKIFVCYDYKKDDVCDKFHLVSVVTDKRRISSILDLVKKTEYRYNGMYNYDKIFFNYTLYLSSNNKIKGNIHFDSNKLILQVGDNSFVYNSNNNKEIAQKLLLII